jgi:hypothetical protein
MKNKGKAEGKPVLELSMLSTLSIIACGCEAHPASIVDVLEVLVLLAHTARPSWPISADGR